MFLDRRGEHLAVGNRPSTIQTLRLGCDNAGKLTAIDLKAFGSAGCAAGAGCAGPVQNMYSCPAVRSEESDVFLHSGPAAAFRAPGHPQGAFGLEQAMDELAERAGIDPVDLRDRNDPHDARREERRRGRVLIGWDERRLIKPGASKGPRKRGVGFAQGNWYNFGARTLVAAEVLLHNDGTVECRSGVQDIGGGIRTAMAQTVAEELGLSPAQIDVRIGDTNYPPGPASGGSVTTQLLLPAVRKAAFEAREKLRKEVPGEDDVLHAARKMSRDSIVGHGERIHDYEGWTSGPQDLANRTGGAQFAEVEVDTETGVVRVLKVVAVHDCGRAINKLTTESQINGGVIQGVSFALFEDRILDRQTGRMVNANLEQYKIAGAKDVPVIQSVIIDQIRGRTNVDASGIGEPATVPTAAAIANAVYHAIGVRLREAPITPQKVLAALQKKQMSGGRP
jgi:xanthine dehydrogenase YagR molybdenum-binding subunit